MKYRLIKRDSSGEPQIYSEDTSLYDDIKTIKEIAPYAGLIGIDNVDGEKVEVYEAFNTLEEFNRNEYLNELGEIQRWQAWYKEQVFKYERCARLGISFDNNIRELDLASLQAEKRVNELIKILS